MVQYEDYDFIKQLSESYDRNKVIKKLEDVLEYTTSNTDESVPARTYRAIWYCTGLLRRIENNIDIEVCINMLKIIVYSITLLDHERLDNSVGPYWQLSASMLKDMDRSLKDKFDSSVMEELEKLSIDDSDKDKVYKYVEMFLLP